MEEKPLESIQDVSEEGRPAEGPEAVQDDVAAEAEAAAEAKFEADAEAKAEAEAEAAAEADPAAVVESESEEASEMPAMPAHPPYTQNRELSWLSFNERVLELANDPHVPLLERLQFVSIYWSNLREFFMVRVGSLHDLSLIDKEVIDSKSNMTPSEQLSAIYARCAQLYPKEEEIYKQVQKELKNHGIRRLTPSQLSDEQAAYMRAYLDDNVLPFLSPQVINARHPFPHLENGAIYIIVRLTEPGRTKEDRKRAKETGAKDVTLGIIPMPKQASRLIDLPCETGCSFILLEDALESVVADIFSMYEVKHTNVICVTRNADLDATEGSDERDEDYREHMRKILRKRARLAPVRLESRKDLSNTVSKFLLSKLDLKKHQVYTVDMPLDLSYAYALPDKLDSKTLGRLTSEPFKPAWPAQLDRRRSIIEQVMEHDVLLEYPYESMDPFVAMLREAAANPDVVSIRITLYRLASQSHLAEALINAAESGKDVMALFELRARFDESNNIAWSQRFEEAGAKVIYGFHDYKVHSKICSITLRTPDGLRNITQLGTGNYNEKTAKLYTDFCYMTAKEDFGRDAVEFFRNMGLENCSRAYQTLWVAPLQIRENIVAGIDEQIALAQEGKPCGLFFKTNSITDKEIIDKLSEASCAGVPVVLLVRGISCIVPQVPGYTENVRVVSIVGRLLEHSRIYGFGAHDDMRIYLSSADLMTRNMSKRIEVAWPIEEPELREQVIRYVDICLKDTAKLRELKADGTYTPLGEAVDPACDFDSQAYLIGTIARAPERTARAMRVPVAAQAVSAHASAKPVPASVPAAEPAPAPAAPEPEPTQPAAAPAAVPAPEPKSAPAPAEADERKTHGLHGLLKRLFGR
ncbi:MAG: polyphosphate kinase 1 [Atopobiaceae bacterium]|jgi:polyphosphate kinase|nr:polyphosphate kinase 1 [Atopobiaceae bacterium]MCI1318676.1 polyphosphate kinase 1 [Atopobiaceae bacterium]MCI1389661.1 polyphosphate kinase 1 [Atopobiaceae bacterium]MCI1431553.1 polyphosphate kinase 1 [Atopobiaceae bacterium]MCI1469989.1 polyphosphate kinase 1 [Atopobiaceae bacterium]